jgi:serine phosphatase RsbU (regulator of sigma subunit)
VVGKGLSAALMMAHLQAVAHGKLLNLAPGSSRPSPGAFVTAVNRGFRGRFGDHRYATMFYGEFDTENRVLRYINAGHCAPIVISDDGQVTKLPEGDLPVGLFADIKYHEHQVTLSRGCSLLVYSDGLTDALNSHGEEFGEERLIRCCTSLSKAANAKSVCKLLSEAVVEWAAGVEQFDDTTILVLTVE